MTFKRDLMYDYEPVANKSVRVGNNHVLNIAGRGKLAVELTDHHGQRQVMTLNNVLHIPRIACNLLSVTDMLDNGTKIVMSEDKLDVLHHEGFTFGSTRANGLYTIHLELVNCASSQSPEACLLADALLLHRRFGHVDLSKVDSDEYPETRVKDCDACIRGKFRRLPFNGNAPSVTEPLAQINADLFGPTRVATHSGARYLAVFIDACTGYVKVFHLKTKSEATDSFKSFRRWVENQTGKLIKNLRTDNGGEFDNQEMRKYCDSRGIEFRTTIPYTSAQNALAERRIGIILNDARTLLLDSGLPAEYWGYAAAHSVYLRNRIPRNGKDISPHEELLKRKPRTDHLRVFGCAAYTWIPPVHRELGKLDARAELVTFLGFEEGTSNCLVVDRDSGRFFRARDVRFVEACIPAKGDAVPDLDFLDVQWEKEREAEHREPSKQNSTIADDLPLDLIVQHPPIEANEEIESDNDNHEPPRPPSPVANRTRAAIRQRTPPASTMTIHDDPPLNDSDESNDELALMVTSLETPRNMTEALKGPDAEGWRESLEKELDSIQNAGTWDLIDKSDVPSGCRSIDSRLVLATKIDPSGGEDHKLKTRLCAKGFTQRHGIDYFETFSPVGHRQSFRLLLSITASLNLELKGLDITTAFLHGPLDETIYMRLPPEVELGHGKIAKLKKALYGLKQAGRCWNEELDRWLRSKGWIANEDDACVYLLKGDSGSIELMLYVHVDDQAIAGYSEEAINSFIDVLDSRFPCKRQGDLKHFLGMEIHRNRLEKKIWITQMQYTNRVLERFSLLSCKTRQVPMSPSVPPTLTIPNPEDIQAARTLPYRELTGSLQYLSTMSRPDITFAVNRMSSFNAGWTEKYFEICKGILRYIAGTRTHGIRLGGTEDGLQAYVDADWNADVRDYKSTTGWIVKYNGGVIGWKSKKQSVQAHSTAEAEYMALDDVARDLVWERRSLGTLGMSNSISLPTPVAVDNQAAITLAKNKTSHDSTKHIHFRFHYIRSLITSKELSVTYLDTNLNHADILTKALPRDQFHYHLDGLGVEQPNIP